MRPAELLGTVRAIPVRDRILAGCFAALFTLNYLPTFRWMIARWEEPGSYMSHGWLVPAISAWLLWMERSRVAAAYQAQAGGASGTVAGWALICIALAIHLVAGLADVSSISGLTMLPLLFGFVAIRFGAGTARAAWFPIAFLAFMVPPPEFVISGINFRLKLIAADIGAQLLNLTGLPAVRTGSFMLFGDNKLAIGDVCSGLRSLLALLAIGVLYAWMVRGRGRAQVVAVLAATVPAAILGNGMRIALVTYLVEWLGQDVVFKPILGTSWDLHLLSGGIIFVGALGTLIGVSRLMDLLPRPGGAGKESP